MLTEKQFEEYLGTRRFEPASANLAERIIGKAVISGDNAELGIITCFRYMPGLLAVRKTVVPLLMLLIIGIMVGFGLPVQGVQKEFMITDEEEML